MRHRLHSLYVIFFFLLFGVSISQISAQAVNVVTQHNNLRRTGWMENESSLNQSNVNSGTFGKIFTRVVDDQIYAQPLVVCHLKINKKVHDAVYVATVSNSVYAFEAKLPGVNKPLWQINLTPDGYRPIKNSDMDGACGGNYQDFSGNIGIVSTPVIDTPSKTMYVVARSVSNSSPKTYAQYLHAIDIRTGIEKPNSPVYITATAPGNGDGSHSGTVTFDQQKENQRAGLLLYNGVVYICWASYCDWNPYHGWMIGYDANTLQQKYVYNATPEGARAGIWMSGQAPAVDENGYIYIATGNGTVGWHDDPNEPTNRGESLLKLSTASGNLQVVDFFTPSNYQTLEDNDFDYGCDGVTLIPNTNISLSGSKQSYLFAVNTTNMGHMTSNNSGAVEIMDINAEFNGENHLHGSPAYFKNSDNKEYIYAWAEDGLLKQIPFDRTRMLFDTANTILGTTTLPLGMPGAILSVSSNALQQNTGIVWASHPLSGDANQHVVPGILQAFAANDVTHELWNSNQNPTRDGVGNLAKFVCPTIANGKVYMATFSNKLVVYGLLPQNAATANKGAETTINSLATESDDFQLYPNPTHDQVTINYTSRNKDSKKALLMLMNSEGKLLYKQKAIVNPGVNTIHVNLPNEDDGLYILQITTEDGRRLTRKLSILK